MGIMYGLAVCMYTGAQTRINACYKSFVMGDDAGRAAAGQRDYRQGSGREAGVWGFVIVRLALCFRGARLFDIGIMENNGGRRYVVSSSGTCNTS
jgi:hypothetical protein